VCVCVCVCVCVYHKDEVAGGSWLHAAVTFCVEDFVAAARRVILVIGGRGQTPRTNGVGGIRILFYVLVCDLLERRHIAPPLHPGVIRLERHFQRFLRIWIDNRLAVASNQSLVELLGV
jgi:hypothetical protein